jgi:adenosine deaminase
MSKFLVRMWNLIGSSVLMVIPTLNGHQEIDYFQKLPKNELHLHLSGAYPLSYLLSIASSEEAKTLQEGLDRIAKGLDYREVFHIFPLVTKIVNTNEKVENGVKALCKALQDDGVIYAEIRTGLKDLGGGYEEYLKGVLHGAKGYPVKILLSLQRNSTLEVAKATVDLALHYRDEGVIGIDLSGDSTYDGIENILPELLRAKRANLQLLVHMGEAPGERDQKKILETLSPDRIGHGVHLCQEAEEWILSHRTPLEVCLTSSVLVQMVRDYPEHPGLRYFRQGHPIVLCTDDPLIFGVSLSQELQKAHEYCGLTLEEIEEIVNSSNKDGQPLSCRS